MNTLDSLFDLRNTFIAAVGVPATATKSQPKTLKFLNQST